MFVKDNKFHWQHMRFVLILARAGRITTAARELHVDPFTARGWLDALEGVLGKRLFHRTRQGLQLTEYGRMMYNFFEAIEKNIVVP